MLKLFIIVGLALIAAFSKKKGNQYFNQIKNLHYFLVKIKLVSDLT